jgi:hypothetical protein
MIEDAERSPVVLPMRRRQATRWRLRTSLVPFLVVLYPAIAYAKTTATTTTDSSIFHDSESQSPPPSEGCFKSVRPSYRVDETEDAHRLVVDIPDQIQKKHLSVDVDCDGEIIEVFGWWMEQKIRGEQPKKMCLYQKWTVEDPGLTRSLSRRPGSAFSLYDTVMELKDRRLTISLPMHPEDSASGGGNVGREGMTHQATENAVPIAAATSPSVHLVPSGKIMEAARKLRGLARLMGSSSSNQKNSTIMERGENATLMMDEESVNVSLYQKSRRDALERFLKFSSVTNDEDSYWLRHI